MQDQHDPQCAFDARTHLLQSQDGVDEHFATVAYYRTPSAAGTTSFSPDVWRSFNIPNLKTWHYVAAVALNPSGPAA